MRLLLLACLLLSGHGVVGTAEDPDPHYLKAQELIDLTMPAEQQDKVLDGMIEQMRANANLGLPEEFFRRFKTRWPAAQIRQLTIKAHMGCYTTEELTGLITFYRSALGQKIISTTPDLMQTIMAESMQIGQRLGLEIAQELQAEAALQKP